MIAVVGVVVFLLGICHATPEDSFKIQSPGQRPSSGEMTNGIGLEQVIIR